MNLTELQATPEYAITQLMSRGKLPMHMRLTDAEGVLRTWGGL